MKDNVDMAKEALAAVGYRGICIGELYYCNRMRLAAWLSEHGINSIMTAKDNKAENRVVWVYDSEDVVDLLNLYNYEKNTNVRYFLRKDALNVIAVSANKKEIKKFFKI